MKVDVKVWFSDSDGIWTKEYSFNAVDEDVFDEVCEFVDSLPEVDDIDDFTYEVREE